MIYCISCGFSIKIVRRVESICWPSWCSDVLIAAIHTCWQCRIIFILNKHRCAAAILERCAPEKSLSGNALLLNRDHRWMEKTNTRRRAFCQHICASAQLTRPHCLLPKLGRPASAPLHWRSAVRAAVAKSSALWQEVMCEIYASKLYFDSC